MIKNLNRIIFISLVLICIFAFYFFKLDKFFSYQNVLAVKYFILKFSYLAPVIIILFFIGLNIVALPNVFFVFLSGYLYGFWNGFLLGYIGTILGFTVSFIIARYFFKDIFRNKFGRNKLVIKIEEYTKKYNFFSVLFFRTFFIIPYSIQNIAYALTDISFISYFIFSVIGSIPQTIIFTFLGYLLAESKINLKQFNGILILLVIIISIIASVYFKITLKKKNNN